MGQSRKDQNSSSSERENYARSEKWQELRRSSVVDDSLHVQWRPNNPGLDETQRVKENDREWKDYAQEVRKGMADLRLGDYARNQKRQKKLIDYAAPYRLNVITDDQKYTLQLDGVSSGQRAQVQIQRYLVDGANSPETVIKGYIDQMRRDLERKMGGSIDSRAISIQIVRELEEYAKPFELVVTAQHSTVGMDSTVNLSLKNVPEYGYKNTTVVIPDSMQAAPGVVGSMLKAHIDKMRNELGWKREEDGMPIQPAQGAKPFVLECPDHGGQMVPGGEEDVFVCLVPGCTKRARRKYKNHVSGTFGG